MVAGDKIIVFVHARVRFNDSTAWHDTRLAHAWTFRNGKAAQMRAFVDRRQALEWAGVKGSDAT
jgi:ketosteroid isomerase-like protein